LDAGSSVYTQQTESNLNHFLHSPEKEKKGMNRRKYFIITVNVNVKKGKI
jgi:hypothetical protein